MDRRGGSLPYQAMNKLNEIVPADQLAGAASAAINHVVPSRNTMLVVWGTISITLINFAYFTGGYYALNYFQTLYQDQRVNKTSLLLREQTALLSSYPVLLNTTKYTTYTRAANMLCTITNAPRQKWSFWSAFDFCVSVITTVGYGVLHPSTWYSRLVCMVYAAIGLPLYIVMLGAAGKYIVTMFEYMNEKSEFVKTYCKNRILQLSVAYVNIGIVLGLFLCGYSYFGYSSSQRNEIYKNISVIVLPRYTYNYTSDSVTVYAQNWTLLESFYYSMISLTTIGFGDYYLGHPEDPKQAAMLFVSVSFGFALFSYAFQVYAEMSEAQLQYLKQLSEAAAQHAAQAGLKASKQATQAGLKASKQATQAGLKATKNVAQAGVEASQQALKRDSET